MAEDDRRLTAENLAEYVGAKDRGDAFAGQCWAEATELVNRHCGKATVPAVILGRATEECGAELFHRRSTKNGLAQFATPDAQPVRVARDPMVAAYPLLDPYLGPGIA